MNKRELLLRLLETDATLPRVPAAFFMHFGPDYHAGQAAIDRHLAYYHQTDMDFVKVQYEKVFPVIPEIERPSDWRHMPVYGEGFYQEPLAVIEGLVRAAKDEALVLVTLYSPFMCAGHTTSDAMITAHLKENPEQVKVGLDAITESLLIFVRACIRLGVDGFYASTQGGEAHRFAPATPKSPGIFETTIKPYDLALMQEIDRACPFNILHVCDYHGGYDTLAPLCDYPGDVVSYPQHVGGQLLTPRMAAAQFGRPVMGGLDRHGAIASGDPIAIQAAVREVLAQAPQHFILGADCTVPGDTAWDDLRMAIDIAHRRGDVDA
jgi:uroporphyrinogen decarboxylase